MATRSFSDRNDIVAARQALKPVRGQRWLGGFNNMFGKELGEWFGTRRWVWQMALWLIIINAVLGFVLFIAPSLDPKFFEGSDASSKQEALIAMGLNIYATISVMGGTIAAIILAQDEIIREKQSGTAAWMLSKPVSRATFVLTKLFSDILGVLVVIVAVPSLVAYLEISLAAGSMLAPLPFLGAAGVILLALVFYISLAIMLGVIFEQRGTVLGISFGVMFGGLMVSMFFPLVMFILPLNMDKIAMAVALGQELPQPLIAQLVSTVVLSVIFTVVALWKIRREEF